MPVYRNLSQIAIIANTNISLSENYAAKQALFRSLPGGDVAGGVLKVTPRRTMLVLKTLSDFLDGVYYVKLDHIPILAEVAFRIRFVIGFTEICKSINQFLPVMCINKAFGMKFQKFFEAEIEIKEQIMKIPKIFFPTAVKNSIHFHHSNLLHIGKTY